jgi:hypothetical protein
MSTTITDQDQEPEVITFERLPLTERNALVNRLNGLEGQLFDSEKHIRRGVGPKRANELLERVNSLRHRLGWLPIDDYHRWGWPERVPRCPYG